jgi:hypothetical protein
MNTPSIEQFLHLTAPKNPDVSRIPHGVAQILERACGEVYGLLAVAHAEVAAMHQPADARGSLYVWEGHEPLQLEGREDRHGKMHLLDIRCHGASVSEHLADGLWDKAEEYLKERYASGTTPAVAARASAMDRADERAERAA